MWQWFNQIQWQGAPDCLLHKGQGQAELSETLLLSHEVQKGPHCFLNFFHEGSSHAAGSRLNPRLGEWLMFEWLHGHNQSFISLRQDIKVWDPEDHLPRFNTIDYFYSKKSLNLEKWPWDVSLHKGRSWLQPAVPWERSTGPGLSFVCWGGWLTYTSHIWGCLMLN